MLYLMVELSRERRQTGFSADPLGDQIEESGDELFFEHRIFSRTTRAGRDKEMICLGKDLYRVILITTLFQSRRDCLLVFLRGYLQIQLPE